MPPLKHPKQEKYCLEYFKSGNAAAAATLAGYSVRSIRSIASELLTNPNIQRRLEELKKKAEDASVMTVLERKQRLTEIARARVSDFVKCKNGISRIAVGLDSVNSGAVQEVISEEIQIGKGDAAIPAVITKLKLRDPVAAIAELNKMDGAYAPTKTEVTGKDGKPIQVEEVDAKSKLISLLDRMSPPEKEKQDNSGVEREGGE